MHTVVRRRSCVKSNESRIIEGIVDYLVELYNCEMELVWIMQIKSGHFPCIGSGNAAWYSSTDYCIYLQSWIVYQVQNCTCHYFHSVCSVPSTKIIN